MAIVYKKFYPLIFFYSEQFYHFEISLISLFFYQHSHILLNNLFLKIDLLDLCQVFRHIFMDKLLIRI